MKGWRWSPDLACSTIDEMGGYIGLVMSLTPWSLVQSKRMAPSYWIGREPVVAAQPRRRRLLTGAVPGLVAE